MTKTILLAEDETLIHEMYGLALKKQGYNVDIAADGEEAINKLMAPNAHYDLVLLDVMMPKLDGISILRKLKETSSSIKKAPVILLTNLGLDDVMKEAQALGAVKCLIKSNTLPQQVIEEVKSFLEGSPLVSNNAEQTEINIPVTSSAVISSTNTSKSS